MKKQILLPTDFSRNAMNAISYALNLFSKTACDFYVLNTYTIEPYTMEMNALRTMEAFKEKSLNGLSRLLNQLQQSPTNTNHSFHMVSECDTLIDSMEGLIDKYDIEMVVMGTKGDTDSRTEIYGSQTVLAMEKIRACPILAIPKEATYKGIKSIVFPTGYNTPYKRREFQYLIDIATKAPAMIHILHVVTKAQGLSSDQYQRQQLLKGYFEDLDHRFHLIKGKDRQEALSDFIVENNCDMVVFINKKHNFIQWVLSKPMVKHLTYYTTIPILALHDYR